MTDHLKNKISWDRNYTDCRSIEIHVLEACLYYNIYIYGVLTEKPYSEPLECKVVYIPITITNDVTKVTLK